jgi:hypothetical protein
MYTYDFLANKESFLKRTAFKLFIGEEVVSKSEKVYVYRPDMLKLGARQMQVVPIHPQLDALGPIIKRIYKHELPNIGEIDKPVIMFDQDMQDTVLKLGQDKNIPVHSGVFLQVTGPQFETPAEIRMYRSLGADTVGMSTGAEVIAARHMGMKVCDINAVSNMAAGMEEEEFTQEQIEENMTHSAANFKVLINGLLDSLAERSD